MVRRLATVIVMLVAARVCAAQGYQLGPDSQVQEGVPRGKVTRQHWVSKIFEGTERDFWVYVPAQYDGSKPACVMVFQDGGGYVNEKGQYRFPSVAPGDYAEEEKPATITQPGTAALFASFLHRCLLRRSVLSDDGKEAARAAPPLRIPILYAAQDARSTGERPIRLSARPRVSASS